MRIAHIINTIKLQKNNELYTAQEITFSTLQAAKKFTLTNAQIELYSTQYPEDRGVVPDFITCLSDLEHSVLDLNSKWKGKKLPFISEILSKGKEIPNFDFLIYTNIDIALMPHFYNYVVDKLNNGHDAIVINRRRISKNYKFPEDINSMYSDLGLSHPGFDCFIVKKELIDTFYFGQICIGTPFLEVSFLHNIASFAARPLYVMDAHLTFHLGTEVLSNRKKNDVYWHNRKTYFNEIRPKLAHNFKLSQFPYFDHKFHLRSMKWMLNPAVFMREYIRLECKHLSKKLMIFLKEFRWKLLQR